MTQAQIINLVTNKYLSTIDVNNPPKPQQIEKELYTQTIDCIEVENAKRRGKAQVPTPINLVPSQIADIIVKFHPIALISFIDNVSQNDDDIIALYQKDGPNMGTYSTSKNNIRALALQYNYTLNDQQFKEVLIQLQSRAPRKTRCISPDLVAVNNGIFNYKTKTLLPFDPSYVFTAKSKVDYVQNPTNPIITHPTDGTVWDVETWMSELSDDPEIVQSLWEILGAIVRPNVPWGKAAWMYSEQGNNGKGTLCELMRNLCGSGSYASIPVATFGEQFALEPLIHASTIIVDENDVNVYIDKAASLKAVVTNDIIQINRKHKEIVSFKFYGFMVQCINGLPLARDRSDSFYRRQLFIPMTKNFEGIERKYIKQEYLKRQDVLEYVLHKVLNTNFYDLSNPKASQNLLSEYKEHNDPIRQFFAEISDQLVWDDVPYDFMYDLYKAWFKKKAPSGNVTNASSFKQDLKQIINRNDDWTWQNSGGTQLRFNIKDTTIGKDHAIPEPLITRFDLKEWQDPTYTGHDLDKKNKAYFAQTKYRGIRRTAPRAVQNSTMNGGVDEDDNES